MMPSRAVSGATLFIAATTLWGAVARAGTWEAIERLPGQTAVKVMVSGKPRLYFRVTPDHALPIPLVGPLRLRVLSRVELPAGFQQVVSYHVRVTEDGRELDHQDTESSAASQVRDPSGAHAIGKGRRLNVDVPAGNHSLLLSVEGAPAVLVRLQQAAPARGEEAMVSLTPIEAPRSVSVTEGEKTIQYYSVMPGKPVRLRVVGPTTLDLLSRLDYDVTMRGPQTYRLGILEGASKLREVEFRTTKATTAAYANLQDRVPSKYDRVRIPVGDGTHEITVTLLAPAHGSAEIHARIPEPSVGSEE